MNKFTLFIAAAAVLLGCVFCAGCIVSVDEGGNENPETITVNFEGFEGGSESVSAKTGDIIVITTQGYPSTGYAWTEPELTGNLDLYGWGYYTEGEEGDVGIPTEYEWEVTADKPGTYTFTTEYARAWEDAPLSTITVTITFS